MSRQILIALLIPFVQVAVKAIEDKFGTDVPGQTKRLAAFKMVKDSIFLMEHIMGAVGVALDDSVLFGLIDTVVAQMHHNEVFEGHSSDVRHYEIIPPPKSFQWTDPKTNTRRWSQITDKGELITPRLVTLSTGEKVPIDNEPVRTPAIQFAGAYPEDQIESRPPEPVSPDVAGTVPAATDETLPERQPRRKRATARKK